MLEDLKEEVLNLFPIKWCHQRVVTLDDQRFITPLKQAKFPIKWCHQRVVTYEIQLLSVSSLSSFQSSGVTSEW